MRGAVGYARVSTDEQARENNSLAMQQKRIATFCQQNEIPVLRIFQESESARTMDRPGLTDLLNYCRVNRKNISRFVVCDLSRLARNVHDQAQIIVSLKQLGITVDSIDEPLTDDSAMGQLVRNMLGSIHQFFSDALSEKTRTRMQAAVKAGRFLWPAPVGYINLKGQKRIVLDPDRAPLVREAFELVASGRYVTTDSVLKIVTAMGLVTKKGKPLTKQTFARMLTNPIYAGWVVSGEVRARGEHEPLISETLFQEVQKRINGKSVPHKKVSEDFPLRGIAKCATCKKPLTAGWVKGRAKKYPRYWCWTKTCKSVSIRKSDLDGLFVNLLSMLEPTAELLVRLPEQIAERWKARKQRIATERARLSRLLAEKDTLNRMAITAKIKKEITADDFDAFKRTTNEEKAQIEKALNALDSESNTMEDMIEQAEVQAIDLVGAWERGNTNQRQELAKAFFPEGLFFSHQLKFFEPANTVLTEMFMRWLQDFTDTGVPDGI
jgi:site-specific DNA recombinase